MARKIEPKIITTMRVSPNYLRRADRIAEFQNCTRSSLLNRFIGEGLKREENRKQDEAAHPDAVGALD